jgi:cupin 2 domain-containing protein
MDEPDLRRGNIFAALPSNRNAEHIETLANIGHGELQRIVSFGQCTADGFWYDQDHDEWVVVLRGRAKLQVEGSRELIELGPGDYINLPAHTRHRVAWTTPEEPTIWLAVTH